MDSCPPKLTHSDCRGRLRAFRIPAPITEVRMVKALWGLLLVVALSACSGNSSSPSGSGSSGSGSSGSGSSGTSYAGLWSGPVNGGFPTNLLGGQCSGQSCARVQFTVNSNNTVGCFTGAAGVIGGCSFGTGDPINGNSFTVSGLSVPYGPVSGVFDSSTTAHGTITAPWDANGRFVNAGVQYTWTASKN